MFFCSKINNKNGFTLIELLAVILILAIIALIAIPVIQDIVKSAKKEALRDTAYGLAQAGQNKCSSSTLQGTWNDMLIQFENNEETSEAKLSDYFNGKNPDAGEVSVNDSCKTAVAIWNDSVKTCAYKGYSDDKVALISMKNSNTCRLEASGDLDEDYVDTGSTGYKCSNPGSVVATEEKYFTFDQATKTITGYDVTGPKDVIIPCTIGGVNVEKIGNSAFASKSLTSVLMPDTILTIGSSAFYSNQIATLSLGSSVQSISSSAFYGNKITNLVLPDSLLTLADGYNSCSVSFCPKGVFNGNPLTSVTFGSGITTIGTYAFYETTTLTTADFSRSKNLTTIKDSAFYSNNLFAVDLTASSTLASIQASAFASNKIVDLSIGGNNLTIGNNAFQSNLITNLSFSGNVIGIGNDAFKNNQMADAQAYIRGKDASGNNTTTLVSYAGANRSNVVIPSDITSLSGASFSSLGISGTLVIGDGITAIESSKFSSNLLTSVTIGNGVKTIGSSAFSSNKISTLSLGSSVQSIGSSAFYGNQLTNLVLPDSLLTLADGYNSCSVSFCPKGVFNGNPLTSVTFGSGITTIGTYAFYQIPTLIDVDFSRSKSLTTIKDSAFYSDMLVDLDLTASTTLTSIESSAFASNKIVNLSITGNNLTIGNYAFQSNLISSLAFSGKIIGIGNDAFKNNQMSDAEAYIRGKDASGNNTTTLVSYAGANRSNVVIPSDITSLSGASFSSLGISGTLVIGDGITAIESSKFSSNLLTSVTIGNGVKTIGSSAFSSNKISTLSLGSSVQSIGSSAFYGNQLTNLVLPDSLLTLADGYNSCSVSFCPKGVFNGNPLTSVTFGSGITTIGTYAFYQITTLTNVDFSRSSNITTIKDSAFYGGMLNNLNLTASTTLASIEASSFASNKIVNLSVTGNNLTIGNYAFQSNLISSLTVSGKVIGIGNDAFKNNQMSDAEAFIRGKDASGNNTTALVSYAGANRSNIVIPSDITSLSGATFSSLGISGALVIGDGITAIESSKFSSNLLTSVTIGNGVKTIGSSAFYSNQISSLSLGSSVQSIGSGAFYGNKLTSIVLPDSLLTLDDGYNSCSVSFCPRGVFNGNPLTSVTLGSGITTIGKYAFYDITTLTNVDLSRATGLTTIKDSAFYSNKDNYVDIPSSVTTIENNAFANNASGSTIFIKGKVNSTNFTSLGTSWNGSATVIYELSSCYTYSGNTITDYASVCSKNVEIPSSLGGNTITTIADSAFSNKGLTRIVLPSTITTIGASAFTGNSINTIVAMGKTRASDFTSLGANWNDGLQVVYDYDDYTCFVINSNIVSNYYKESVCPSNVVIPSGITEIATNSFINKGLSSVTIPNTVTTIGNTPFTGNLLSSMTILDGTNFTSLGTSWNGNVLKVNFQGTSIEKNCFTTSGNSITKYQAYCPETIDIPTSIEGVNVTSIADNAFKGSAVRYINIPSVITSIGANAFEGNDIVTLGLNDGLNTIGNSAFKDTGLLTLSIPSTVMTIGDSAFALNNGLSVIYVNGKTSSAGFTSLGTSWNGTCNNIIYNG
jgi:prepilin-type N-terminal cleavage/methylation domain-containing protein